MAMTINQLMDFSWMSQASYLDFSGLAQNDSEALRDKLKASTINAQNIFATDQATAFTDLTTGFSFTSHTPNDVTGFSTTVFKSNSANEYTISVRGTEPSGWGLLNDLVWADGAGVVFAGQAIPQLMSAFRYYKQITTAAGQDVQYTAAELDMLGRMQVRVTLGDFVSELLPDAIAEGIGSISTLLANDQGLGELIPAGATVNFTGHSLGGHVAYLLADMVARSRGAALVGNVVTYNAPGQNALLYEPQNWLGPNSTDPTGTIGSKHVAIFGEGGIEVTAGLGQVIGTPQGVFIEEEVLVDNHSVVKLSDSLALYSLFATLDPSLNTANPADGVGRITKILKAVSADPTVSLELTLDSLRTLFQQNYQYGQLDYDAVPTLIGDGPTARNDYYANLQSLQAWWEASPLTTLSIQPLAEYGGTQIASMAMADTAEGQAYRYALYKLNPFVVSGSSPLYDGINAHGELNRYDPATGTGNLTEQYLNDRAAMMSWKLQFGTNDTQPVGDIFVKPQSGTPFYFEDFRSNGITTKMRIGGGDSVNAVMSRPLGDFNLVVFGSENNDALTGQGKGDRIYGGAGADTLTGNAGNDYLEGGAGFDTYVINPGDGTDTILDSDGAGVIKFGILEAKGSGGDASSKWLHTVGSDTWADQQNGITYTKSVVSGETQLLIHQGDSNILVKGWAEGELGIELGASIPSAPPTATLTGADGYSDVLRGTASAEHIMGLSGNDLIADTGGNDLIEGGLGDDLIAGGTGSDLIHGGTGKDMILSAATFGTITESGTWQAPAGAGPVWIQGRVWGVYDNLAGTLVVSVGASSGLGSIYGNAGDGGDTSQDSAPDIVFAGDDDDLAVSGLGDDYLDGGLGHDQLWGHGGNDVIDGGADNDQLYGDGILAPGFYQSLAATQHGNDVLDGGAGIDQLIGGGRDDGLFGGAGNDTLYGDDATEADLGGQYHGTDYLDGGGDDDELLGGGKDDTLLGGAGADKLWGDADDEADLAGLYHGNDYLDGGDGNDQLVGGGGNDILVGGANNDVMQGDARLGTALTTQYEGDDILYGDAGDDQLVGGGGNDHLYGGTDKDTLLGEGGLDLLDGGTGNDTLDGGTGADIMAGGADDDTYLVDDAGDVVIEAAGEGIDTVNSAVSIALPDHVEKLNLTGAGDIGATGNAEANNITGNAGANRLEGGAGNDQLIGGAGADTLIGGTGDDYYEIDDTGDFITEALGEGVDFVRSTMSYALDDNLEVLALDGSVDLTGSGNDLINSLYGNLGNNTLAGGIGNDYLVGDAGDDVYVFNRGEGQDSIDNTDLLSATDTLRFGAGIAESDVVGYQVGTNMVLKLKGTSEQVAFIDYFGADAVNGGLISDHKIDRVEFANSVVWDQAMIQTLVDRAANNHAPVLTAAVPGLQAYVGNAFNYVVPVNTITDPDAGDSVVYSVTMPDGSALPAWLAFDAATRTLSGTPDASSMGNLQFVLRGTDDYGYSFGHTVNLNINTPNQAPVLSTALPDQSAVQGSAFSYTVAASTFTDPDAGDVLGYSATQADGSALPSWLNFDAVTRTFSGTPSGLGTLSVRVTASDTGSLSVSDMFDIVVSAPNRAPVVSTALPDQGAIQGNVFNYTVAPGAFTDPDAGDTLAFSATLANGSALPSWLNFDAATRSFSGTPSSLGTISVRVTASDAGSLSVSDAFDIVVSAPNRAPVLSTALPDLTAVQGNVFSYTVAPAAFTDPDVGDTLAYNATLADGSALPSWLSFDATTRIFSGIPSSLGTTSVRVMARDVGNLSTSDVFDIVVSAPNRAPVLSTALPDRKLAQGGAFTFTVASTAFTDPDAGDVLSYSASLADGSALPSWLNFNATTRTFSGTLGASDTLSVRVTASDTGDLSVSDIFDIKVFQYLVGTTGTDILSGGAGDDQLYGNTGDDTLYGGAGNDRLDGGAVFGNTGSAAGNDTAYGGAGDDVYWYIDTVVENADEGIDTWVSRFGGVLPSNVENLSMDDGSYTTYSYTGTAQAYGNDLDNVLTTAGEGFSYEILDGRGGADTVIVRGDDRPIVFIDNAGDRIILNGNYSAFEIRSTVSHTLVEPRYFAYPNDDTPISGSATERLLLLGSDAVSAVGNVLNNVMTSYENTASNSLSGGAGNDVYVIDVNDRITEEIDSGNDKAIIWVGAADNNREISLAAAGLDNIERVGLAGDANNVTLRGNAAANDLFSELSRSNYTFRRANLLGEGGDDRLVGGPGYDYLDGGTGADYMAGGSGGDIYIVDNAADQVVEYLSSQYNTRSSWDYRTHSLISEGGGYDSVYSSVSRSLEAYVEELILTGTDVINGTGNELANILIGNSAANVLDGSAGVDSMEGGAGNDIYIVDDVDDVIIELADTADYDGGWDMVSSSVTYTLNVDANIERLSLVGTAAIDGTGNGIDNSIVGNDADNVLDGKEGDDYIVGNDGSDYLIGGAGDDALIGGRGTNTLIGGAGDDSYLVSNQTDVIIELAGEGIDTIAVDSNLSTYTLVENIENIIFLPPLMLEGISYGITIFGNDLDNVLTGNTGNDLLDGRTGADTLVGGMGNDTYVVDNLGDVVSETSTLLTEIDSVQSSIAYTLGANVENLALTGIASINGTGNELANVLTGNSANNTLIGGVGDDILLGSTSGTSASTSIASLVIYARGTPVLDVYPAMQIYVDGVLIQEFMVAAASYTAYTVDPAKLGMAAGKVDVVFTNDAWRPDLGQDRNLYVQKIEVNGQTMNTTDNGVFYDPGSGTAAFDGINLRLGQETLASNGALRFTLADNDTLDGGTGADQMSGGNGNDTYLVDNVGDVLTEMSNEGVDTVRSGISHTLGTNLENLTLTGSAAINGSGNVLNNLLIGNAGNNILYGDAGVDTLLGYAGNDQLDGGAGNDLMYGGQGNDTYVVESTGDGVSENANEGWDTVESSISHTLGANVESLTLTGTAAINGTGNALDNSLTGNSANNLLTGGAGNDALDGGAGADVMAGGAGDDYYIIDNAGDIVTENAGEGTSDSVELYLNADYAVGADIEHVYRYGSGNWTTTGNAADNYLYGNSDSDTLVGLAGNDILYGDAGADTLIGGVGDDRYYVDSVGDIVTENTNEGVDTVYVFGTGSLAYTLAANVENGYSPFWAGHLTGNALNNMLSGSYGSDTLDGGLGADTLKGWGGNDTYIVDNVGDVVSETSTVPTEIDTVQSSVTYTLGANLENLTLTGAAEIDGTGNELANVLRGNSARNVLSALDGNDTIFAGDGDGAFGGEGSDTLVSENTNSWTALSGEGGDDVLIGGAGSGGYFGGLGNDTITGGLGMNFIWGDDQVANGLGGNDVITGGNQYDYVIAGWGDDLVYGLGGDDNLSGNQGNDTVYGGAGDDFILGGQGDDFLDGGTGADTMTGGAGNDTYILGRGYDADTVVENDATAGNIDIAQFLTGVSAEQIWFQQVGNNLEASIIGTSDKLVVQDWYLGSANHVEQFKTTDGAKTLLDSNVANLVNAMASFAPPAAGQTSLPTNYQTALAPVIAANWQ